MASELCGSNHRFNKSYQIVREELFLYRAIGALTEPLTLFMGTLSL